MKSHDLIQGTPEWHQHRNGHYNASDAPAMMGVSTYETRDECLTRYLIGATTEINSFQRALFDKGHLYEAAARPIAEKLIGEDLFPCTGSKVVDGFKLSASFDGLTLLDDTNWEHKMINEKLRGVKAVAQLDEMYKIQMDQQMLVSGAAKTLFMASNGTEDDMVHFWYKSAKNRQQAIVAGWKQFEKDLANHVPPQTKPAAIAGALQQLPALSIMISGKVDSSNLVEYQSSALAYIDAINTELKTDQDFADAEANVKFCKQAEDDLKHAKAAAISSTADIDTLMKAADYLMDQVRQKRLTLERLVKSEKESRRSEISTSAIVAFRKHCDELDTEFKGVKLPELIRGHNFYECMKNKRTIESLQNAINTELATAKIAADQAAKVIRVNLNTLTALTGGAYDHLFKDLTTVISKDRDDFEAMVNVRIHDERKRIKLAAENLAMKEQNPVTEPAEMDIVERFAASEKFQAPDTFETRHPRTSISSVTGFDGWWDEFGKHFEWDNSKDEATNVERLSRIAWSAVEVDPF